mmetsp:Transcript_2593/g.5521  ORF Transcript_2593/g.5521 Transcript_2593/m.5521 type:complete len:110 (+) Transcript_2593:43-372(+)
MLLYRRLLLFERYHHQAIKTWLGRLIMIRTLQGLMYGRSHNNNKVHVMCQQAQSSGCQPCTMDLIVDFPDRSEFYDVEPMETIAEAASVDERSSRPQDLACLAHNDDDD